MKIIFKYPGKAIATLAIDELLSKTLRIIKSWRKNESAWKGRIR